MLVFERNGSQFKDTGKGLDHDIGYQDDHVFFNRVTSANRYDFRINTGGNSEYNYVTKEITVSGGADDYNRHVISKVVRRLEAIASGADYHHPGACQFAGDLKDVLFESQYALGSAPVGSTIQSALDSGPDLDIFETELSRGAEYFIRVDAIEPNDANLDAVRFDHGGPTDVRDYETGLLTPGIELIDIIEPMFDVLNEHGVVVASSSDGGQVTYVPTHMGTHYIRVGRAANAGDAYSAGIYTVTIEAGGEGDGDFPADTSTEANLSDITSIPASITNGDTDWFRIDVTGDELYTVVVRASGENGVQNIQAQLVDANGDKVAWPNQAHGVTTANGHQYNVIDIRTSNDETYYVAVSAVESTGDYVISIEEDDHPTMGNAFNDSLTGRPIAGVINGEWDHDRIDIIVPDNVNWTVNVKVTDDSGYDGGFVIKFEDDINTPYQQPEKKRHTNWELFSDDNDNDYITLVPGDGWAANGESAEAATQAYFAMNITPKSRGTTPIHYEVSATHRNTEIPDDASDKHLNNPANFENTNIVSMQTDAPKSGTYYTEGSIYDQNGNHDIDSFNLVDIPVGTYRWELQTSVGVTGMQIKSCVSGTCGDWQGEPEAIAIETNPDQSSTWALRNVHLGSTVNYTLKLVPIETTPTN